MCPQVCLPGASIRCDTSTPHELSAARRSCYMSVLAAQPCSSHARCWPALGSPCAAARSQCTTAPPANTLRSHRSKGKTRRSRPCRRRQALQQMGPQRLATSAHNRGCGHIRQQESDVYWPSWEVERMRLMPTPRRTTMRPAHASRPLVPREYSSPDSDQMSGV